MPALLASLVLMAGGPPPPGAPIPRDPAALAARLETTTRDLADAVDRWRASGGRRVPEDVTLDALYQQRILILLGEKRRLSAAVLRRLPPRDARPVGSEVLARRGLGRLSQPRPLSAFRTGRAEPVSRLLRYYLEAQRRFGVAWNVLAAVNYVESAFNKLRNASSAGAQGPMQFIPATWARYGEGDINSDLDSIRAAARYLRANGAPANMANALFRYNQSQRYVRAVTAYAEVMRADPDAYRGYYQWQVYYLTTRGDILLAVGYGR
jgi:membrane-bound lytic murein transglycosylase B